MFEIKFSKKASKYYRKLPQKAKDKIDEVLEQLREDPYHVSHVKPLEGGETNEYRIRIGPLRLLYRIYSSEVVIIVFDLGPRGDIY